MARASADYTWNFAQWTIGLTGLITDKLGMAPHKDTFYTVRRMPDNNNVVPENYPDLHRYLLYFMMIEIRSVNVTRLSSRYP